MKQATGSAFLTLMIEAISLSKASADFQQTTQDYIPEGRTLLDHCCENLCILFDWHQKACHAVTGVQIS
jgi:hypothetical protein